MNRVYAAINLNGSIRKVPFTECLLRAFPISNSIETRVKFCYEKDEVILSYDVSGHRLLHSHECPFIQSSKEIYEDNISSKKQIPVAVSLVIESSDHKVLLTKRSSSMRSSPSVWVPPGGHLEQGESLLEAGFREVEEETGLRLNDFKTEVNILCLWENVYPLLLGLGTPKAHVLVIYYHVRVWETSTYLTKRIRINPDEVKAITWLSSDIVAELFRKETDEIAAPSFMASHTQFVLKDNNQLVEIPLHCSKMFSKVLWTSGNLYSGVQCALYNWLKLYKTPQSSKL